MIKEFSGFGSTREWVSRMVRKPWHWYVRVGRARNIKGWDSFTQNGPDGKGVSYKRFRAVRAGMGLNNLGVEGAHRSTFL